MTKKFGDALQEEILQKCDHLPDRPKSMLKYLCKDLNLCRDAACVQQHIQSATLLKALIRKEGFYDFDKTVRNLIKKYRL